MAVVSKSSTETGTSGLTFERLIRFSSSGTRTPGLSCCGGSKPREVNDGTVFVFVEPVPPAPPKADIVERFWFLEVVRLVVVLRVEEVDVLVEVDRDVLEERVCEVPVAPRVFEPS